MTVRDALSLYVQFTLENLPWQDLVEAEFYTREFGEQFGDLDVEEVGRAHINEFCRQPKEEGRGVHYWLPITRRQAARVLTRALTWATATAE
jgi:hypothetical protein